MNKRVIIGLIVLLVAVVFSYSVISFGTLNPDEHQVSPQLTDPASGTARATGGVLATDAAGIHGVTPTASAIAPGFDGGDRSWEHKRGAASE